MEDRPVKFDIVPQIEVVLKSIDLEHKNMLRPILVSKEVDRSEKDMIYKYLKLLEISGTPNNLMLEKEFPGRNFEVEPIELEALPDYIQLYLYNRKNIEASKALMELSTRVRMEGMNEEVLDELTKLTKSESVQHKFTNIKDYYQELYDSSDYDKGIPTGIKFVDEITGGIHKGEITTLTAFAGHGKTTAGMNIAYNALRGGQNVLYCSFEVSKRDIYSDLLSRHSNDKKFKMRIPHFALKKKALKDEQYEYAFKTIKPDLDKLPGYFYVTDETEFDSYSLFTFESKFREVEKLAIKETGHGIDIVFIDHIQLLKFGSGRATNSGEVLNEKVSWFRQNAINWLKTGRPVSFVILSQANRAGYEHAKENNGKYDETAMAEANELERASALVLTIYSETEMKDLGIAKVQILKYRDSRNEDEPTEVNIDLKYYLFGDVEAGTSELVDEAFSDTTDTLEMVDAGDDILEEFKEFMPGSLDI